MPSISGLGDQRQEDLYEFEVSLDYRASFRTDKSTQRHLIFSNYHPKNKKVKVVEVYVSMEGQPTWKLLYSII